MTQRVLVTGAAGLLGRHLVRSAPAGTQLHRSWRSTQPPGERSDGREHRIDLVDLAAVMRLMAEVQPDVVIHTAYDQHDLERGVIGATNSVAAACAASDASLVHISSDVVFDGEHAPYEETNALCPISAYGKAKARAERLVADHVPDVAIVRTSLLCAADPPDPRSAWVLDPRDSSGPITLFEDEIRGPARVDDVAARIWSLADIDRADRSGPWHLVGPEALSRYEIGRRLLAVVGADAGTVRAGRSADQPLPRPRDLRLVATRRRTPMEPNRPFDSGFGPSVASPVSGT